MPGDIDPDAVVTTAMAHHEAGQLDLAEAGYRNALFYDPNNLDALNLLGLIVQGRGKFDESIALITRALQLEPDFPEALTNLARAHRAMQAPAAAVEAARRAIVLDAELLEAHLQLGGALVEMDDNAAAIEVFRHAAGLAPNALEAQVALGTALVRQKDYAAAVHAWRAALAVKTDDQRLLIDLAVSLGALGETQEALATFRRADAVDPDDPRIQYGTAMCLLRCDDIPGAAQACRRAVATTTDQPKLWLMLASCEAKLGHFDVAADAYRHALALEPGSVGVLRDMAAIGEGLADDTAKDAVRATLDDEAMPVHDRIAAGYALGRSCDQYGEYEAAFAAYALANRLVRADRAARGIVYDRGAVTELVDWLIAMSNPQTFADTAGWGDPSDVPVFIVGMPRSGTTLVEQIASSHKLVFGAGERNDIDDLFTVLGRDPTSGLPGGWDRASVRRETAAHVSRLRELAPGALRVIDKMPDNVLWLGLIARLFPGARVVLCRRDPRDQSLSCFFQNFRQDMTLWTNDLADCGFRARQVDRLVQHWRKVLPLAFLEVEYEALVGNLEAESRRLIDFLGLEWDPACLTFHETERTVLTASYWQVRQPLYVTSVGRWRHYRHHLRPLLDELNGLVARDEEATWPAS